MTKGQGCHAQKEREAPEQRRLRVRTLGSDFPADREPLSAIPDLQSRVGQNRQQPGLIAFQQTPLSVPVLQHLEACSPCRPETPTSRCPPALSTLSNCSDAQSHCCGQWTIKERGFLWREACAKPGSHRVAGDALASAALTAHGCPAMCSIAREMPGQRDAGNMCATTNFWLRAAGAAEGQVVFAEKRVLQVGAPGNVHNAGKQGHPRSRLRAAMTGALTPSQTAWQTGHNRSRAGRGPTPLWLHPDQGTGLSPSGYVALTVAGSSGCFSAPDVVHFATPGASSYQICVIRDSWEIHRALPDEASCDHSLTGCDIREQRLLMPVYC